MGRPRKNAAVIDEIEQPLTAQEIQSESEYQEFLSGLGDSGVTVTIHRFPKVGKDMEWVDDTSLDQAHLSVLREKYGPGKYRLNFRYSDGSYAGHRTVCIAAPYASTNGNGKPTGDYDEFMKALMLSLIANLKPAPAVDVGAMLGGIGAMITALKPAPAEKSADPIQMVQAISQVYQNMKDKNEKDPLTQLRDVAGVIKEFSGDSKIDGPWDAVASVGKDVVDKLAPVLTGMVKSPNPPVNLAVTAGRPAAALPPVNSQPGGPVTTDERPAASSVDPQQNLRQWLAQQIAFFKQKAQIGKDPGFWTDYVFENGEEPGCQAILYAIKQGATFEQLLAFDPEIGQNHQLNLWFKELYDGIKSGLQDDLDSPRESGDAGNPSANGGPRPTRQPGTIDPASSSDLPYSGSH